MGPSLIDLLNVRVVGSGKKVLVLSHGLGTDQSVWGRILPYFDRHYKVILYDLVCAGSVNPDYFDFDRYSTLEAYADDLINILDSLGVDRCFYVGHSLSSMIGILAAVRRPNLFSKLILIGASPRFLNDKDYHGGFEEGEIEKLFFAMESNYDAWVKGFAPLAVGADVPAAVREFSRTLFNVRPDISLYVSRVVFNSDLRPLLGMVKVPCCIIRTQKDVSVPASVATYLKDHLGGRSTVEVMNVEGHLPHLSAPALLAHHLNKALSR
uniref:probable strigolactone esterase DAD2 n=1 Tax=Erigeron canadensis TaxID=72917 RepID=UPI001CB8D556|nr:probable strigolactone esterase DAD2 [Erigeron canadensis]